MIKMYKVGGCVRDKLLGVPFKDIDYSVEAPTFAAMEEHIASIGKIYLSTPQYYTIRAKVNGEDADFVMCRKDGPYSDGRRPDWTEPGTLIDDLSRRDFTVNAMAEGEDGTIYDYFGGMKDLERRRLRCVGDTFKRLDEDPLRLLRAMRFRITKGFSLDFEIEKYFDHPVFLSKLVETVSHERIREELRKCFAHNTWDTMTFFKYRHSLSYALFADNKFWLEPTNRKP